MQEGCELIPPRTVRERIKFLGPGIIFAIAATGTGGLTVTPRSGAIYGYSLLWVFVITLIYKYAFNYGSARFTVARGEDIFKGLKEIPGPENWAVVFLMLVYLLEMIGYGGIALAAGTAIFGLFPTVGMRLAAVMSITLVALLLYKNSYTIFEKIILFMSVILIAGVIYSFLNISIPANEVVTGFVPTIPEGSLLEIMELMGWVGAGTTTLLYSGWLKQKIGGAKNEGDFNAWMKSVRLDITVSYILIGALAFVFLAMGVFALHAEGLVPEKEQMMLTLSNMLAVIPSGAIIFLIVAYFTLFSALLSGVDGRARAFVSMLTSITNCGKSETLLYRILILSFVLIIFFVILFEEPTEAIGFIASASAVTFAILGFMMIYFNARLPPYARGSTLWIIVMSAGSIVFLLVALLREKSILEFGIPLVERMAVVMLVVYLLFKSTALKNVMSSRGTTTDKAWIVIIFGLLSIYGTIRGIAVGGAIINIRDLGPIMAGIVGGPFIGVLTGLVGGLHRYSLGGWTALPCAIGTIFAGLIAGFFSNHMKKGFYYSKGIFLTVFIESFHVLFIFPLLNGLTPEVLYLIRESILPMIVANTFGVIIFLYILKDQFLENRGQPQPP